MTSLKPASTGQLIVTRRDRRRLDEAIRSARRSWLTYGPYLDWLQSQLNAARVVGPEEMPDDVVTMNSHVDVEDLRTGEALPMTLVYPDQVDEAEDEAAADRRTASIFDPTGLALLGRRVGDVLSWMESDSARTARVTRLPYQPESAGDEE